MKRIITATAIGALMSLMLNLSVTAQEQGQQSDQKYKSRYSKDLFNEADSDHDGFVDWDEARSSSKAIEQDRMGRKRFNQADVNGDGRLSVLEAKKYKHFEVTHREGGDIKVRNRKDTAGKDVNVRNRPTKKQAVEIKKPYNKERVLEKKRNTRKRNHGKSGSETDR